MDIYNHYRGLQPGVERNEFRMANHSQLERAMRQFQHHSGFNPQAANTLAAALTPDYLSDALFINARNRLAPLAAFSRLLTTDPMKPRATVEVPRATVGATGQTNATNFETGDTTLAAIAVTVNQLTVSFHLTNDQINKGHEISKLAAINADNFADAISDVWTALDIAGNFGTAQVIGPSTAFAPDDLPPIFTTAKNFRQRNLLLDGSYLAYLFPGVIATFQSGVGITSQGGASTFFGRQFGFDGLWMQGRWTGATANSVGFVCSPDAIAVASGLPLSTSVPSGEFLSQQIVNLDLAGSQPSLGLPVQINSWYSRATRTTWASFDVMFGAAAGETNQGKGLVSA